MAPTLLLMHGCLAGLVLLLSTSLAAQEKTVVVAGAILPGIFDETGSGPYAKIFNEVKRDYTRPVILSMMPERRAKRAFLKHETDCVYLGTEDPEMYLKGGVPRELLLMSGPINTIYLRIYTRPGEDSIQDLSELKGHNIVLEGYIDIPTSLRQSITDTASNVIPGLSMEHVISLLQQKRAKAAILFDFSLSRLKARNKGSEHYPLTEGVPLLRDRDTIVCWKDEATEAFIAHVDARLEELYESGWHERTFN